MTTSGFSVDQVAHDREVVRSQIPDDVYVVLEQPEIDPHRVIVEELAERAVVNQLADLANCAGKQEGMIHHDPQVLLVRQFDQFLRLGRG